MSASRPWQQGDLSFIRVNPLPLITTWTTLMPAQTLIQLQGKFKHQSRSSIKLSHTQEQESSVCKKFCLLHLFLHFSHFLTPKRLPSVFVCLLCALRPTHLITMSCIQDQIQDSSFSKYNTSVYKCKLDECHGRSLYLS